MIFGANGTRRPRPPGDQPARLPRVVARCGSRWPSAYSGSLPDGEVFRVSASRRSGAATPNKTSSIVELSLVSTDPDRGRDARQHLRRDLRRACAGRSTSESLHRDQAAAAGPADRGRGADRRGHAQPVDELDAQIARGRRRPVQALIAQRESELDRSGAHARAAAGRRRPRSAATLGNLDLGVELAAGGGAEVLSPAGAPDTPVSPNMPLNLAIGLVVRPVPRRGARLRPRLLRRLGQDQGDGRAGHRRVDARPHPQGRRRHRPRHGHPPERARRRGVPPAAHVGQVPRRSSARSGSSRSPARRPARARRWWRSTWPWRSPRRATGSCWSAATSGGPAWRRCSTSR